MTVCILKANGEIHSVYQVKCETVREVIDVCGFGTEEVGRRTICSMESDTEPTPFQIYEMKCKDESCSAKRFQVLEVKINTRSGGKRYSIAGAKLSDEEF